jgi:hypothetical protein
VASRTLRLAVVAAAVAVPAAVVPASAATAPAAPAVIAVIGEPGGLNVLHNDFRTRDGRDAVLPAGVRAVRVTLPRGGDFAERIAALTAGPLGHLQPGTLYYVAGTRLLVLATKDVAGRSTTDILTPDRVHATGVVDAAIGRAHGTAPDALAVFVTGGGPAPWAWVAAQPWVDVASTSSYSAPQVAASSGAASDSLLCESAAAVRKIVASGRVVFSSSGNTTDQPEALTSPNGLPEVFQVGGVDAHGKTWTPGHSEESDPFYAAGNVVRPYDTGELFSFPAAAPDSVDGTVHFGGTSGATPRTAGWAAVLVASARRITGGARSSNGSYTLGRKAARGPLSDGRFTGSELAEVLRHSAVPAEAATPGRYFVEGYGALNAAAVASAVNVLAGRAALALRPDEDAAAAATRQARGAAFNAGRCAV